MSENLHVKPREPLAASEKWNNETGCLTIAKAGLFTVEIVKTDALHKDAPTKLPPFKRITQEEVLDINDYGTRYRIVEADKKRDEDEAKYKIEKEAFNKKLQAEFNTISWCWEAVGKGMSERVITHNASFNHGLPVDLLKQVRFPKLLEGGGLAWLEVFTDSSHATGQRPDGIFVNAIGTPKIIAAEWRDFTGKLITEDIAYGSTVYLHIYTEALYGENIEIQLEDNGFFIDTDLALTTIDKDGKTVQKLEINPLTRFTRPVGIHEYNASTKPPAGTITDAWIANKGKEQISTANVQKCVFPVFIESAWQFQAEDNFNSGSKLSIIPVVYHANIKDQKIELDNCELKVCKNGILMQGALKGNNPLMQDGAEKEGAPEDQKKIDFIFGVFIDGTNNNRYDTIARTNWEEKRIGRTATTKSPFTNEEHLKVYAKSKNDLTKKEIGIYKYGNGSYENDLSNVAILFDNYIEDKRNRNFKVYTEGMNTNTLGDENLNVIEYKGNDVFMGGAIGSGNSGIVERVRRAIRQLEGKILKGLKDEKSKKIDSLTIDVFGFSRGAASARHFVHAITYPAYYATMGFDGAYCDHQGYRVSQEYQERKKALPTNGYLGYLLVKEGIEFNQLIIRFAGLYDTVAHHGAAQFNDIKDLGLNSISKAKHVIHMVAAEEHRKNFSLSPIIKSKNHVEIYMPGVHCDVGGSYTEGRPEGIAPNVAPDPDGEHILESDYCSNTVASSKLSKFRDTLIDEGWFEPYQIDVRDSSNKPFQYDFNRRASEEVQQLVSQRAYISNQYSFIPLHMMCNFGIDKGVKFDFTKLEDSKNFKKNIFEEHLKFIKKIRAYLEDYAEKAMANPLEVVEHEIPKEDMRKLRNHYLHYDATDDVINGPEPNRKRFMVED